MPVFTFEKWYFDGQTDDGTFFFLYLAPMTLLGRASAELVVSLFPAGGEGQRCSINLAGADVEVDEDRMGARFLGGALDLNSDECRFKLKADGAEVDLTYQPIEPDWAPTEDGVVARQGSGVLRWVVPVPLARLRGSVAVGGDEVTFDGYGYSDYVRTDIPPWSLPLRELLWGRALGPDTTLIWNRVGVARGKAVEHECFGLFRVDGDDRHTTRAVAADFHAWEDHAPTSDRYPTDLRLDLGDADPCRIRLHPTTLNLGEFVADVQEFNNGLERWLYRSFTGDPVEYKLLSSVTVDGVPREAWAAHEWIRWGRGRS